MMRLKSFCQWFLGSAAVLMLIAVVSGQFGLWTPPLMLLGPPLFTLIWR